MHLFIAKRTGRQLPSNIERVACKMHIHDRGLEGAGDLCAADKLRRTPLTTQLRGSRFIVTSVSP